MIPLQTGAELMQDYSQALSQQLQRAAERLGLDIAETEELMQWASTATTTHSQSISLARQTLMNGLKDFALTMNDEARTDVILTAMLQAEPGIRYATIVRKPGKPPKITAYAAG